MNLQVPRSRSQDGVAKKSSRWDLLNRKSSHSRNASSDNTLVRTSPGDNSAIELYSSNNTELYQANQQISIRQSSPTPSRPKKQKKKKVIDDYGLKILHDPTKNRDQTSSGAQYAVDIVAVHGLNGNPYETWTTENSQGDKVNWLRDFLPKDFPGARIFSYGYPAAVFWTRETGDITTAARGLLEALVNERFERQQKRPIIFIGHSMGGLVIKQALIISVLDTGDYTEIKNSVKSIFFFATPHLGSAHADTAANMAMWSNIASLGIVSPFRSHFLKTLRIDSRELYDISMNFRKQTPNITIYSFLEGLSMKGLGSVIVTPANASMGVAMEKTIPMSGSDHRSIVRFAETESSGYKAVIEPLKRVVIDATSSYTEQIRSEDEPCLQSLSFTSQDNRFHDIEQKSHNHTTTSTWILTHPVFQTWIKNEGTHSLLWINGHPGTGKSTLMKSLSKHLSQSTNSQHTIRLRFFFDSNGAPLQKSQLGMFRSLLCQIYRQSISARATILSLFEEKMKSLGEGWEWHLLELQELLFTVIQKVSYSKEKEIVLVVDALDEASAASEGEGEPSAAQEIIGFFHRLSAVGGGRVKICFSSRHYPNIHMGKTLRITVEEHNEASLRIFVEVELERLVAGWEEERGKEKQKLVDVIVGRANRQFLWACIRVPMVAEGLNSGLYSLATVYRVLEGESNKLSDLYTAILAKSVEGDVRVRSRTLELFQWIALSHRPLSLGELRYAVACSEDVERCGLNSCEELEAFVESDERMEKLIKRLSGGLAVVLRHGDGLERKLTSVRFIHNTVYEFVMLHGLTLLFPTPEAPSQPQLQGILETRIVRSCINYLRSRKVLEAMETWDVGDEKDILFIEYAALQWPYQAGRSEFHGISQAYILDLLGPESELGTRSFQAWLAICLHLSRNQKDWQYSAYSGDHLIHIASSWNLKSVVRALLDIGTPVDLPCYAGKTALYRAGELGNEALVAILLKAGADGRVEHQSNKTPLERAAANSHGRVVNLFLAQGSHSIESLDMALHGAAHACDLTLIERFLAQGANINSVSSTGKTALQIVAGKGDEAAINLLIAKGANVNTQDHQHDSALQAVCQWTAFWGPTDPGRGERLARCLLDAGADVHFQGGETGNALQAAVSNVSAISMALVTLLLDEGADADATGGLMGTCLQAAASADDVEILQKLLDTGADIDKQGGLYGNALHAAAQYALGEASALFLIDRGANVYTESPMMGSVLQSAAYGGSLALAKRLISMGVDVNLQSGKYGNALHAAVSGEGGVPMVDLLLDHGADIDIVGEMFGSPLESAIAQGRHLIVRLLVQRGADIQNHREPRGERSGLFWNNFPTPLLFAARYGKLRCVRELLDAGLDINEKGVRYGNVFSAAVGSGMLPVVQLLLDRGVQVNAKMIDECLQFRIPKKLRLLLLEQRQILQIAE